MKEKCLKLKKQYGDKYKNGYPLIVSTMLQNPKSIEEEGEIIALVDCENKFIGRGYLGKQNKGEGWVLTQNESENIDKKFFYNKINKAIKTREKLYKDENTDVFRIFNGEGDGIGGLTIDKFNQYYLINWYSKGIYNFKDMISSVLIELTNCKGVYEKKRFDTNGMVIDDDSFIYGEEAPEPLIVKENGVNFAIYLNDGAMVGVFLDQRDVRKTLRDKYSKGKTVLNTFSYTGAFSVFAAKGGATKTTSVDVANRSISKTRENFSINNINYEDHDIIVEDIFNYFKYASRKEKKFDVVVLDPPSFARSKKFKFSASKNYGDIVKSAIDITVNKGIIVASTNCANFDMKKFKGFIKEAFKEKNKKYEIIEQFQLPSDFKVNENFEEGNYLKVLFLKIM